MRGSPKSVIHDGQEEASRADVLDVEGAGSNARLAEEEASILAKQRRASYSADVKVT